jgi:hypothetical protein
MPSTPASRQARFKGHFLILEVKDWITSVAILNSLARFHAVVPGDLLTGRTLNPTGATCSQCADRPQTAAIVPVERAAETNETLPQHYRKTSEMKAAYDKRAAYAADSTGETQMFSVHDEKSSLGRIANAFCSET